MPRLLLLAFVLFAAPVRAQEPLTWELLPDSPFNGYRNEDIFFLDEDRGWSVHGSGGGSIWRTLDGGATWTFMEAADGYFRSVAFVSEEVGWVGVLFSGTRLYETRDGGLTLTDVTSRIQPAVPGGICSLYAVSDQVVYGAGEYAGPAYLIKTTDGGQTWASISLSAYLDVAIDTYFLDEQHGFVAGGVAVGGATRPRVIGTNDGGATWTVRHTFEDAPPDSWLWKLSFPAPQVGYASVEHGYFGGNEDDGFVLKTTDGGQTWTEITIPDGDGLQGVGFVTPDIGWASGRGTTSMTTDGGQTWGQVDLDGSINRFRFVGDVGYAAGHYIYKLDASLVAAEPDAAPASPALVAVAPNPARGPVTATYRLGRPGTVEVAVYDLLGRAVAVLDASARAAGLHTARWDAGAARVPPGVYVVRLTTAEGTWARTVTVLGR